MRPQFLLLLLALLFAPLAPAESVVQQWVTRYDGPANSADRPTAVAVDGSGNVVVTGYSFGVGSYFDYYTAKYASADGSLLWETRYSGAGFGEDVSSAVAVDGSGNVIVTGHSDLSGSDDFYTAKYAAADGALLWERRYNGPGNATDSATAVAVDGAGNVVVTGESFGLGTSFDFYTAKYAGADGSLLWEKRYNGLGNGGDTPSAVAVDGAGNVVVTGSSYSAAGNQDLYTAKYAAADGNLLWEKSYSGPGNGNDVATAMTLDGSNNVVVTGFSWGSDSSFDYYTAKYAAADGSLLWEKRYSAPFGSDDRAAAVAVDSAGNVVVTGLSGADCYTAKYAAADGSLLWEKRYTGGGRTIAIDGSGNVVVAGSIGPGFADYYTAKYAAADGSLLWEARYDGPANRNDVIDGVRQLALTSDGGVVVTGRSDDGNNDDYATVKYLTLTAPVVMASAATGATNTTATLHGTVNPGNVATTAQFEYGPSTSYGSTASITLAPNNGGLTQTVSAALSGLSAHTTYHYRVSASNSQGTTLGSDQTFTTANSLPAASNGTAGVATHQTVMVTLPFTTPDVDGDAVTVTATSASGGAPFTLGVVSGNTVAVTGADSAVGTGTLSYTVSDGFGGTASGSVQITVTASPNYAWRQSVFGAQAGNPAVAGDLADPNGNGVVNLLEYALGGDPLGSSTGLLPTSGRDGSNHATLSFTRSVNRTDLTLTVQGANAVGGPWTELAQSVAGGAFTLLQAGAAVVESGTGDLRGMTVSDLYAVDDPAHPTRFLRLEVAR